MSKVKEYLKKLKENFIDVWKYADAEDKKLVKKALGIRGAAAAVNLGTMAAYGHEALYTIPSLSKLSYYFLNNPVSYVVAGAVALGSYSYYLSAKAFRRVYKKKKNSENEFKYDFLKNQKYYY